MGKKIVKNKPEKKPTKTAKSKKAISVPALAVHNREEIIDLPVEQLHEIIKKLTLELSQTNMQLDQFAHTSSHELQEPLRKITIFTRALQQHEKKLNPATIKSYITAAVRMTKLIQDMLNFTLVTNYEKLFIETDLNEVLKNVLFDLELVIEEKQGKIICHNLPCIEAVPFQMNQLFYDILHNALKFSKPDVPPVIEISAHKLSAAQTKLHPQLNQNLLYFEIQIKDNGIGFDQKYAQQIFTMFQRLSAGGAYAGTGIGLAICKKIVQNYFGEIYAEGIEDKGAIIHMVLPVTQPNNLPEDIPTILKTWL
jgi:two-component system CheB/CheR fusion protein